MKGRKMKLEHIINVDFANLVHSGSDEDEDEYDFDLVQFKYTNAQTPYWIEMIK